MTLEEAQEIYIRNAIEISGGRISYKDLFSLICTVDTLEHLNVLKRDIEKIYIKDKEFKTEYYSLVDPSAPPMMPRLISGEVKF